MAGRRHLKSLGNIVLALLNLARDARRSPAERSSSAREAAWYGAAHGEKYESMKAQHTLLPRDESQADFVVRQLDAAEGFLAEIQSTTRPAPTPPTP